MRRQDSGKSRCRPNLRLPILLAFVLIVLPFPDPAIGLPGDLSFVNCYSSAARLPQCDQPPTDTIGSDYGLTVSPDGRSVYSTAPKALNTFVRTQSGGLQFTNCVANSWPGCSRLARPSISFPTDLVVSPDGQDVYVTGSNSTITTFGRGADGQLNQQGCISNKGRYGCRKPRHNSLGLAEELDISHDGRFVYVTSANSLTAFRRMPDGRLRFADCIAADGLNGCKNLPGPNNPSLCDAVGLAVSPNGRSIYVSAACTDVLSVFDSHNGRLRWRGCIGGRPGCKRIRSNSLDDPGHVEISPDGRSVYVVAEVSNALTIFRRARSGALRYQDCIANRRSGGCRVLPHFALGSPSFVAASPDGASVYLARGGSILQLDRHRNGNLSFGRCYSAKASPVCSQASSLGLNIWLALSPDGGSLYVSGEDAISGFSREGQ